MEIPLLKESTQYIKCLKKAVSFQKLKYSNKKEFLINYKFNKTFENKFQELVFKNNSLEFEFTHNIPSCANDLFGLKFIARFILKALAHKIFFLYFFLASFLYLQYKKNINILRKSHVEDVDNLFKEQADLNLIFPFPLNISRQIKYLLRKKISKNNILCGYNYTFLSLYNFLKKPTPSNLLEAEIKGQLNLYLFLNKKFNFQVLQTSDEYELGTYFAYRFLRKKQKIIHNKAHGVGKYLPLVSYNTFDVMTNKQIDYYSLYSDVEKFNLFNFPKINQREELYLEGPIILFFGQYSSQMPKIIHEYENKIIEIISEIRAENLKFFYRPHPNNSQSQINDIPTISKYIISERILNISLFSSTQIDNNFQGDKILIRTTHIFPEISFDCADKIINIDNLKVYIEKWLKN